MCVSWQSCPDRMQGPLRALWNGKTENPMGGDNTGNFQCSEPCYLHFSLISFWEKLNIGAVSVYIISNPYLYLHHLVEKKVTETLVAITLWGNKSKRKEVSSLMLLGCTKDRLLSRLSTKLMVALHNSLASILFNKLKNKIALVSKLDKRRNLAGMLMWVVVQSLKLNSFCNKPLFCCWVIVTICSAHGKTGK